MRYAILFIAIFNFACGNGPKVTVCISDPGAGGFQCVDPEDKVSLIPYGQTGNYVCFSPSDARSLLEASSIKSTDLVSHVESRAPLRGLLAQHKEVNRQFRSYKEDHMWDHLPGE